MAEKVLICIFFSVRYKVKTSQHTVGFPILINTFCPQIADSDE